MFLVLLLVLVRCWGWGWVASCARSCCQSGVPHRVTHCNPWHALQSVAVRLRDHCAHGAQPSHHSRLNLRALAGYIPGIERNCQRRCCSLHEAARLPQCSTSHVTKLPRVFISDPSARVFVNSHKSQWQSHKGATDAGIELLVAALRCNCALRDNAICNYSATNNSPESYWRRWRSTPRRWEKRCGERALELLLALVLVKKGLQQGTSSKFQVRVCDEKVRGLCQSH